MNIQKHHLLLADDDDDDCAFFREALDDLNVPASFFTVSDGVLLMKHLLDNIPDALPDIVFLDLNMPRKSGFECLTEIKNNEKLKHLPVIIFSTSFDQNIVDVLYDKGAIYYIRKPGNFSKLRSVIGEALNAAFNNRFMQPAREHFILES